MYNQTREKQTYEGVDEWVGKHDNLIPIEGGE